MNTSHATVTYPGIRVRLTGCDGNAFALINKVQSAIRAGVGRDEAETFAHEALQSESYDDLLQFLMRMVEVS